MEDETGLGEDLEAKKKWIREQLRKRMNWESDIDLPGPEPVNLSAGGRMLGEIKWPKPVMEQARFLVLFLAYATNEWVVRRFLSEKGARAHFDRHESAVILDLETEEVVDIKGVRRE